MNRKYFLFISFWLLIFFLILLSGFKNQQPAAETSSPKQNVMAFTPVKVQIMIRTEKEVLHYERVSFYRETDFSEISKSTKKFSSNVIANFKKGVQRYNVEAFNCTCELNTTEHSQILNCDVKGPMYSANSYDFHWLLEELPFDLYQFTQSERELNYNGKINDIHTKIRLIFGFPIAHCHEHVWPAR